MSYRIDANAVPLDDDWTHTPIFPDVVATLSGTPGNESIFAIQSAGALMQLQVAGNLYAEAADRDAAMTALIELMEDYHAMKFRRRPQGHPLRQALHLLPAPQLQADRAGDVLRADQPGQHRLRPARHVPLAATDLRSDGSITPRKDLNRSPDHQTGNTHG